MKCSIQGWPGSSRGTVVRLVLYFATVVFALTPLFAEEVPAIANEVLSLQFDPARGALIGFTNRESGWNYIRTTETTGDLWEIRFSGGEQQPVTPSRAGSMHWTSSNATGQPLLLEWSDFGISEAPGLRVSVTVGLPENAPESRWHIAVENAGPLALTSVAFPRVKGIAEQPDEELAVPVWMGERTTRVREILFDENGTGRRIEWPYPGTLSLQCLAFYRNGGPGLYLACDDTAALLKSFAVFGDSDRQAGIEMTHLIEQTGKAVDRYELPYNILLCAFNGDWFTVAERYRVWGVEQSWARESRVKNSGIADWAADTALWVWNRGRSGGVLAPAEALRAHSGLPVSVFWHWWHGCAYDMGFPEYLPPREGNESFVDAIRTAHDAGVHAIVYMNQRLWGITTRSWSEENATQFAVKDAAGKIQPEVYNTFTKAPCASMCMGTDFWRGKYAGLAEDAFRDLGVDGIYMDQACSSLACYDSAHEHSIGGGGYWIQGFQRLAADIRSRCDGNRHVVLAGEGCGEAWLPHLDLMLSLQVSMERYAAPDLWEPIPFFHAVYHGYAIFYGNYSSLTMPPYDDLWPPEFAPREPLKLLDRKFTRQFRLEQARAFVWGQQPTIANFLPEHLDTRSEELDYVLKLARLRMKALKFLLHGTMMRRPVFDVPVETIDISRLSIYAGQQEVLKEYQKEVPAALASAWRANDRDVAVVLVSISDAPMSLSVPLDRPTYDVAEGATIRRIDATGEETLGRVEADAILLPVSLPPCGACIFVFD